MRGLTPVASSPIQRIISFQRRVLLSFLYSLKRGVVRRAALRMIIITAIGALA